jgi:ABC-type branched-subunit amino acid transport system substrate-binding protein
MMPHFPDASKSCMKFFALLALLAFAACSLMPADEDEDEQDNAPAVQAVSRGHAPRAAAPDKALEKPKPSPVATEAKPPESRNDYAPASHISVDNAVPPAPGGTYAPASQIGALAISKAPTVKVGLLIPMSGESAELGKSLLDAAVLAVYDKYSPLSAHEITAKVELLPKDTGDSVEGAEKAAQDAVQEGAKLLLGPVFSKQVNVVALNARHKDIPVITFSNNIGVAGDGVYLFGFIPEQQVIRIVQYSLGHGVNNIAALVPSNPYGAAIVKQLATEVRKHNGRVHPIEYYSEDMQALDNNVGRLARFIQDEPVKGQALFVAEGGDKLKALTDTLTANGIGPGKLQLLGTGLWDDPEIIKWPAIHGGWFASSPPERYRAFEQRFIATYSYKPERRASLSYDAVALAISLALASNGAGFPKEMITDPIGFNGPANGIFRFHDDGSIERGLSILMVTPSGFKGIDPAPTTFNE